MNLDASVRSGLHPSIVLSAYVEPLVRGRRVAVLGDASIRLAEELSQRGARLVHVYDPDAARTAEALAKLTPGRPHQIAYAVLAEDLGVRDGAFDVVVVPDLSLFADPAEVMRRARRLCSAAGVAVFVTPNGGAGKRRLLSPGRAGASAPLGYYELYDLVSLQFAKVRMIGQAPFVGYTVADFSPRGEPEVSVDTSLLATSEEPEHFIALASDRPVSLDAYAVIELPWHDVADGIGPGDTRERDAAREAAEARLADLNAELAALRAQAGEHAREAEARAGGNAALSARVAELEGEVGAREGKLREIEARAGDNHVRAERLQNQIRDLDEELRRQRDRGTKLSKLLDDEKKARTKAEVELGMLRGAPGTPGPKERADALAAELAAAQARLSELELEAAETKRRPTAPLPPDPALLARLGELEQAIVAARREGAEAAAQRDAALDRARRAEARVTQLAELEAKMEAATQERLELGERARATAAEVGDLERRLLSERDRASAAAKLAADATHQLAAAEKHAAEAGTRAARAAHEAGAAEKRAAELEARLGEQDQKLAALHGELAAAQAKARGAGEEHEALAAAEREIAGLESALLDRGRAIAALTRDLREAERVGRELLGELEGGGNGAPAVDVGLRGRLDTLAESAARAEADLQTASWRIAQLERELGEARRAHGQPERAQIELEEALAAARDEVAALRRALGGVA